MAEKMARRPELTVQIAARLRPVERQLLEAVAVQKGVTASDVVREALREVIRGTFGSGVLPREASAGPIVSERSKSVR